jgi:hypothetical protein
MIKLRKPLSIIILGVMLSFLMVLPSIAASNSPALSKEITFDSFTGVYHLSRDKNGLSLLTSEETILADFPATGNFYGITRSLPDKYQGHSVDVKVLNITDVAGSSIPYTAKTDGDNLVITTGDKSINLYGSQTFKINYQTKGVINLNQKNDEFLLNINGRGWDQPFAKVNATLNIPSSSQTGLVTDPSCYLVLNSSQSNACQIQTKKNKDSTIITSTTGTLQAHQALVLKLEFAHSTFTNTRLKSPLTVLIIILVSALVIGMVLFFTRRMTNKSKLI